MSKRFWAALSLAAGLAWAMAVDAQPASAAKSSNDYTQDASWLCRPGRADACAGDQTTTVVAADGSTRIEAFKSDPNAKIDCFYVYPTVSTDPGGNSDMTIDQAEKTAVDQQLARFGGQCRLYAPMYRQLTLAALLTVMRGQPNPGDEAMAYDDVRDAWNDYLARDNKGRGVVLIGHSQGSIILLKLLKDEIDGKPVRKRLVSALVLGINTPVDPATSTYGSIPLCKARAQVGCMVTYSTFRAGSPPSPHGFLGRTTEPGKVAGCVNPAAPGGGLAPLHSYFAQRGLTASTPAPQPWAAGLTVNTPFVSTPGLVSAECVTQNGASFLAISVRGDPADPRVDDIPGDLMVLGSPLTDWGLHRVDVNLAMGDLVDMVAAQSKAYSAR